MNDRCRTLDLRPTRPGPWAAAVLLLLPGTLLAQGRPASAPPRRVEVVRPERVPIRHVTEQPGQIQAFETTAIHAKVAGYVREVAVNIGDRVKRGQVLARLDVPELDADVTQMQAKVQQAQADVVQAKAAIAVAVASVESAESRRVAVAATLRRADADVVRWEAEYRRIEQLVRESAVTQSLGDETRGKRDSAVAARDEARAQIVSAEAGIHEAKAGHDKARADVTAAEARVAVARAGVAKAEAMLSFATLTAPFDGVVTHRGIDTGHLTVPGATSSPLFVVARTDIVTAVVDVPENEATLVDPGDAAQFRFQALGGRSLAAKVSRTAFVLDPSTRTQRVEIDLPNEDGTLRPGLYAYASIVAAEKPDALSIPATAVLREGPKTTCVVVVDGKAHRQPIQTGLDDGKRIEVVSGLTGNERVVATGPDTLLDGQAVEGVEPKPAAAKP